METDPIQEAAGAIHAASLWQEGEGTDFPPGVTPPAKAMKLSPGAALDAAIAALKAVDAIYLPATIKVLETLKTFTPV